MDLNCYSVKIHLAEICSLTSAFWLITLLISRHSIWSSILSIPTRYVSKCSWDTRQHRCCHLGNQVQRAFITLYYLRHCRPTVLTIDNVHYSCNFTCVLSAVFNKDYEWMNEWMNEWGTQIWRNHTEDYDNIGGQNVDHMIRRLSRSITSNSAQFTVETCVTAGNREKFTKTRYFWGSRSFKVIDVGTTGKLSSSAVLVMICSKSVSICNRFTPHELIVVK